MNDKGFSIVEVAIVISVLAIVAAVAIPLMPDPIPWYIFWR